MASLRSGDIESLLFRKKLVGNTLPTNSEVIEHFYHVRQVLMDTESKFSAKEPEFNGIKQVVISDVVDLWRKASLAVIKAKSTQNKLNNVTEKFVTARKRAKKFKCSINEDWFSNLFDLSRFRCEILETIGTYRGNYYANVNLMTEYQKKKLEFLKDQRSSRKMILSESKDMVFNKRGQQVLAKTRNNAETDQEQLICSKRIKITDTP